jgi:hypothetical protein
VTSAFCRASGVQCSFSSQNSADPHGKTPSPVELPPLDDDDAAAPVDDAALSPVDPVDPVLPGPVESLVAGPPLVGTSPVPLVAAGPVVVPPLDPLITGSADCGPQAASMTARVNRDP